MVGAPVSIHYQRLSWLARRAHAWKRGCSAVFVVIFAILVLHTLAIGMFGIAWFALLHSALPGSVSPIV